MFDEVPAPVVAAATLLAVVIAFATVLPALLAMELDVVGAVPDVIVDELLSEVDPGFVFVEPVVPLVEPTPLFTVEPYVLL
jgi:hypothetical protein